MAMNQRITHALSRCVKELSERARVVYKYAITFKLKKIHQRRCNIQDIVPRNWLSIHADSMQKEAFKTKSNLIHCDARKEINEILSGVPHRHLFTGPEGTGPSTVNGNDTANSSKSRVQLKPKFSTSAFTGSSSSCPGEQLPSSFSGARLPCYFDIAIIGAGIVGTATARELSKRYPTFKLALVDKESEVAVHQSHRNSGVIHAGIYYPPNSRYARLCVRGCEMMYKYCDENDIPYKRNGKLIVAVDPRECPELLNLFHNASTNNVVGIKLVGKDDIPKIEPHCVGIKALHSPNTGVVSYRAVTQRLAQDFLNNGGQIFFNFQVEGFGRNMSEDECYRKTYPLCIYGNGRRINAKYAVVCAGLYADRMAQSLGGKREPMILPIRGNFLELKPEYRHLVRGSIYPVPEKNNPFPGVHATHREDGSVKCGPSAVIATHRQGYKWYNFSPRDCADIVTYRGSYRAPFKFGKSAYVEYLCALSTRMQANFLRKYIPEIRVHYLQSAPSGVAALALNQNGILEKDLIFEIVNEAGVDDIVQRTLRFGSSAGRSDSPRMPSMEWFLRGSPASSRRVAPGGPPTPPPLPPTPPPPRSSRLMEDTEGALVLSHTPSLTRRSRISQLKMPGCSRRFRCLLHSICFQHGRLRLRRYFQPCRAYCTRKRFYDHYRRHNHPRRRRQSGRRAHRHYDSTRIHKNYPPRRWRYRGSNASTGDGNEPSDLSVIRRRARQRRVRRQLWEGHHRRLRRERHPGALRPQRPHRRYYERFLKQRCSRRLHGRGHVLPWRSLPPPPPPRLE